MTSNKQEYAGKASVYKIKITEEVSEIDSLEEYVLEHHLEEFKDARRGDIIVDEDNALLFFVNIVEGKIEVLAPEDEFDVAPNCFRVPTEFPFNYWNVPGEWTNERIATILDRKAISEFKIDRVKRSDIPPDVSTTVLRGKFYSVSFELESRVYKIYLTPDLLELFQQNEDDEPIYLQGSPHSDIAVCLEQ